MDINFLFLILLSFTVSIFFKSLRQGLILKNTHIAPIFKDNFVLCPVGLSMNITSLSVGQMIKSHYHLKHYHQSISKTLPMVIIERCHDVSCALVFSDVVCYGWEYSHATNPKFFNCYYIWSIYFSRKIVQVIGSFERLTNKINLLKISKTKPFEFITTLLSKYPSKVFCCCWLVSIIAWFFEAVGISSCFESPNLNFSFGFTAAFLFRLYLEQFSCLRQVK